MESLSFEEYLTSKKIDPKKFEIGDEHTFNNFKELFDQVHPKSFTAQKLFLINNIRRKFPLELTKDQPVSPVKKKARPTIKRKQ